MNWISIALGIGVAAALVGGIAQRIYSNKGIGWQFIRYTTIVTALPLMAILALEDALSAEAAAILSGALGFSFGKASETLSKKQEED